MKKRRNLQDIGINFDKELRDIQIKRRLNVDKDFPKELGKARITDAIVKTMEWKSIKEKIIDEPRKEALRREKELKRQWFI